MRRAATDMRSLLCAILLLSVSSVSWDATPVHALDTCTVVFAVDTGKVEVTMANSPVTGLYYIFDHWGNALGIAWNNGFVAKFYIQPGHEDVTYTIKGPDPSTAVVSTCGVPTNGAGYVVED